MTSHVVRLYALALSILGLFLAWLGVASHPWQSPPPDPQSRALAVYQQRLEKDAALVAQLASTSADQAPPVRIITAPPVTTSRTS